MQVEIFVEMFEMEIYPSQTKILEGVTKEEIRMFAALFKVVSNRFGLRTTSFVLFSKIFGAWDCPTNGEEWHKTAPNEDFGRPDQPLGFRSIFQRFVAQIEYSHHWKVLRKRIRKSWFDLPKSSFGRGKLNCAVIAIGPWHWVDARHGTSLDTNDVCASWHFWKIQVHISSFVPPSQIFVWGA